MLFLTSHHHTTFTMTIEFGRMVAMYMCKERLGRSAHEFAIHIDELKAIQQWTHFCDLSVHPITHWKDPDHGAVMQKNSMPQGNNHFRPTIQDPISCPYLVYAVNAHHKGKEARLRYVTVAAKDECALSHLTVLQPPRVRGGGSFASPHVGWLSLLSELRIGDRVYFYDGKYPPSRPTTSRAPSPSLCCSHRSTRGGARGLSRGHPGNK
jgi:hypothetical protein